MKPSQLTPTRRNGISKRQELLTKWTGLIALSTVAAFSPQDGSAAGPISFSGATYTQDFQSMTATVLTPASVATTTMLEVSGQAGGGTVDGWYIYHQASGTPRWGRTDGSSGTGSFFAMYDAQGTPNRALGSEGSSSIVAFFGIVLKNTTGSTLNSVTVTYDAVMNRNPSSTVNSFPVSYRVSSTTPVTSSSTTDGTFNDAAGTWTSDSTLSFSTPSSGIGAPGAQASISPLFKIGGASKTETITGLNWGNNQYLYIRWKETDEAGSDAIAGVDNFVVSVPGPSVAIDNTGTPPAGNLTVGATDVPVAGFRLTPGNGNVDFTALNLTTAGTATSSDLGNFRVVYDADNSGTFNAGDSVVSGAGLSLANPINFTISGQTGFSTARRYLIVADVAPVATGGNTFTGSIASSADVTSTGTTSGTASGNQQTIATAANDMTLAAASGESATLSSLLNDSTIPTTAQGAQVWQVSFNNPSGNAGSGTISALTFTQGANNGVANWSSTIQVAELFDGSTALAAGTISATSIAFSGLNVSVADSGSKTLSLRISLKSTPGVLIDNSLFQFALATANVTISGNGLSVGTVSSDQTQNKIAVVASKLAFSSVASSAGVGVSFSATVRAQDINGNTDLDDTTSVTITKASGTGTLTGGGALNLVNGNQTWFSLQLDTPGVYTLQAAGGALTSATSGNITISAFTTQTANFAPIPANYPLFLGSGTSTRLPTMYRATVSGLLANATYRYYSQGAINTDFGSANAGAGNPMLVSEDGATFTYTTSASLNTAGGYETFTTDGTGSYTGWFGFVYTGNARFAAGATLFPVLVIGDNTGAKLYQWAMQSSITCLTFSTSAGANNGTGIRGTSSALAKNFVALYDNAAGTGRPLALTYLESEGTSVASVVGYYGVTGTGPVDGIAGAWGTIVPNTLANGVQRIAEFDNSGALVAQNTDSDGSWPSGVNTVNPAGGTTALVIANTDAPLQPTISGAATASAFSTTYGTASLAQSFPVSGSSLIADIVATAPTGFEVSSDGVTYGATATIVQSGGVASGTLSVRLSATAPVSGSYDAQNIVLTSTGCSSINIITSSSGNVVNPATLTYSANSAGMFYGDTVPVVSGTVSGFVNGETEGTATTGTLLFSTTATSSSSVGSYSITGSGLTATNYVFIQAAGNASALTINPLAVNVTANPQTKVYGNADPLLTYTFNPALVGSDSFSGALSRATGETVGSYAINQGSLALSPNYNLIYSGANLSITPASLTVTANSSSKVYGQTLTFAGTEFTTSVLVGSDSVTSVTLTSDGASNAAPVTTYSIVASAAIGTGLANYNMTYSPGILTVSPAVLGVTANDTNRIYGATNPTFTVTYSGFANGETLATSDVVGTPDLQTSADTNSPIGTYVVTNLVGTLASTNYSFSLTNGTLTVAAAALTVTAEDQSRGYGAANPTFTYTVTGFVNDDTASVLSGAPDLTTDADTNSTVGVYVITNNLGTLSATNYVFTLVNGTLTVTQASLTVTANNDGKTFDGNAYTGGNGVTYLGFVNGETSGVLGGSLGYGGTSQGAVNVGGYSIIPSGLTSANYAINYVNGTLTIVPLTIVVTADPQTKIYGTVDPALTYTSTPSLVGSDTFSGSLSGAAGEAVGTYAIAQGTLSLSPNYTLNYAGANLTITPASLSITANSTNKVYGQTLIFTGTEFTTSGLVSGDSVGSVTLTSAGASNTAPIGTYSIVASAAVGSGLSNYSLGYVDGVLTVTAAPTNQITSITANPDGSRTVTFNGVSGYTYRVQAATDLSAPVWVDVSTNTVDNTGSASFTDTDAIGQPTKYYRTVYP